MLQMDATQRLLLRPGLPQDRLRRAQGDEAAKQPEQFTKPQSLHIQPMRNSATNSTHQWRPDSPQFDALTQCVQLLPAGRQVWQTGCLLCKQHHRVQH